MATVDVADESALKTLLAQLHADGWPPVRGVVQAAGVPDARALAEIKPDQLAAVLRPKTRGTWLLHHLLRDERLFHERIEQW